VPHAGQTSAGLAAANYRSSTPHSAGATSPCSLAVGFKTPTAASPPVRASSLISARCEVGESYARRGLLW
jgi:hypothetical protein